MMWVFGLFLLLLLSPKFTRGSSCFVETLKCGNFRPIIPTHKNLFISSTELKDMCRQHDQFFKCLDQIVASRVYSGDGLSPALQNTRSLIKDLCLDNSSWQQRYLEFAPCINRQYTEFCTNSALVRVAEMGGKLRSRCSLREQAVACIAATLAMHCGIEAGQLFHHLLQMTSDDKNCNYVGSEILNFPEMNAAYFGKEEYELRSRLSKRTGSIGDETGVYSSAELPTSTSTLEKMTTQFNIPYTIEAIELPQERYEIFFENLREINSKYDAVRFHSNTSLSIYAKHSGFNMMESISCDRRHGDGTRIYMWCYYSLRKSNPRCYEGSRGPYDPHAAVIPENIDPEFGVRLYAMFPLSYHFRDYKEIYDWLFKRIATTDDLTATDFTTANYDKLSSVVDATLRSLERESNDETENLERNEGPQEQHSSQTSTETVIGDMIQSYIMGQTEEPAREVPEMGNETTDLTSTEVDETIFGTRKLSVEKLELLEEAELFRAKQRYIVLTDMDILLKPFAIIRTDIRENSRLRKIICGRVNECHPDATYVFKCSYFFNSNEDSTEREESGTHSAGSFETSTNIENTNDEIKRTGFWGKDSVVEFHNQHPRSTSFQDELFPIFHWQNGIPCLHDECRLAPQEIAQYTLLGPELLLDVLDSGESLDINVQPETIDNEYKGMEYSVVENNSDNKRKDMEDNTVEGDIDNDVVEEDSEFRKSRNVDTNESSDQNVVFLKSLDEL